MFAPKLVTILLLNCCKSTLFCRVSCAVCSGEPSRASFPGHIEANLGGGEEEEEIFTGEGISSSNDFIVSTHQNLVLYFIFIYFSAAMHPLFKICGVPTHIAKYSATCFHLKIKKGFAMMQGFMWLSWCNTHIESFVYIRFTLLVTFDSMTCGNPICCAKLRRSTVLTFTSAQVCTSIQC